MLVSLSWLSDYIDIADIDRAKFKEKMIMTGSNAENTDDRVDEIKNVALVRINKIEPHPDAEKLVVCTVDLGDEETIVVTGAKNMVEGDYVLLAKHNSRLPGGVKIKKSKLRGVLSNGMFLSYEELGFAKDVIPKEYENGIITYKEPICELGANPMSNFLLDDYILEFEITPNRPDCLSIMGMAKEVKASFNKPLKDVQYFDFSKQTNQYTKSVKSLDGKACPRFMGLEIEDVVVTESPEYIKSRLMSCGIRPINSIVDLGNLVMMETGQPLHCYDYDKLNGNLTASLLEKDTELLCLDDETRTIPQGSIVISDDEKIVALAGIMGAKNSAVSESTSKIFLESANFNSSIVRQTSKKVGLRSESSSRNEKGINAPLCEEGLTRFAYLVEKFGFGKVTKKYCDDYVEEFHNPVIEITKERVNSLLGTDITETKIIEIFKLLGFAVEGSGVLKVAAPYHRTDIKKDYDLIEEVARIYGYENIPETMPKLGISGGFSDYQEIRTMAIDLLISLDYSEVVTYSFIGESNFDKMNIPKDSPLRKVSRIKNPIGEEFSIMRPSLLSSVMEVIEYNVKRKNMDLKFFELSSVFDSSTVDENSAPVQGENIVMVAEGKYADFFKLKSDFDKLMRKLHVKGVTYVKNKNVDSFHTGRTADIMLNGEKIGVMGEIHPLVLKNYGITTRVSAVEIDYKKLDSMSTLQYIYQELPKYPAATRDVAVVVDKAITNGEIKETIYKAGGDLLESVKLFDIYEGDKIEDGKKSIAYALVFRDKNKTLEEAEITKCFDNIIACLEKEKNAILRS